MIFVNGCLLCLYAILLGSARLRNGPAAEHMRNWIPLGLMLLAYKEMGWLAPPVHYHRLESAWIVWDRLLLREWRLRDLIESAGPPLPLLLETCFLLGCSLPLLFLSLPFLSS